MSEKEQKDSFKRFLQRKFDGETLQPSENLFDSIYEKSTKQTQRIKSNPYRIYKIAAAISIPLLIGSLVYLQRKDNGSEVITTVESKKTNKIEPAEDNPFVVGIDSMKITEIEAENTKLKSDAIKAVNIVDKNVKTEYALVSKVFKATKSKEHYIFPDSSAIALVAGSQIAYVEKETGERTAKLTGNGHFQIKSNPSRPFIVSTTKIQIRVTGTSFLVSAHKNGDQHIFLEEGEIVLSKLGSSDTINVLAGESYSFSEKTGFNKLKNVHNEFVWKTGILNFEKVQLSDVLLELRRYFKIEVSVIDKTVLNCYYSGNFKNSTPEKVLAVIAATLGLEFETKTENSFILKGSSSCKSE